MTQGYNQYNSKGRASAHDKVMYRTAESAHRHFGRRCTVTDCWHWCPKCGTYWCHYIDTKSSLDSFVRVCYSDRKNCLVPPPRRKPTDTTAIRVGNTVHPAHAFDIVPMVPCG